MARVIFVNLPVADLARATAFYEATGFTRNPMFCDETTANCMVLSESIFVMLLTHEKFRQFTPKAIADTSRTSEVLLCVNADTREGVDSLVDQAVAGGGKADPCPKQDHGFMYGRSYEDLDGHIWEVMWMDMAAFQQAAGQESAA